MGDWYEGVSAYPVLGAGDSSFEHYLGWLHMSCNSANGGNEEHQMTTGYPFTFYIYEQMCAHHYQGVVAQWAWEERLSSLRGCEVCMARRRRQGNKDIEYPQFLRRSSHFAPITASSLPLLNTLCLRPEVLGVTQIGLVRRWDKGRIIRWSPICLRSLAIV